jgi:Flp pilus assembly protein TadD
LFVYLFDMQEGKPRGLSRISRTNRLGGYDEWLDPSLMRWRPSTSTYANGLWGPMDYDRATEEEATEFVRTLDDSMTDEAITELLHRPVISELEHGDYSDHPQRWTLIEQLFSDAHVLSEFHNGRHAIPVYRLLMKLTPDDHHVWTNLAVVLDKTGIREEAEGLYIRAANRPHFDAHAMFNLGYLYDRDERSDDAELWYRRTLVAEPTHSKAMVNLAGLIFRSKGAADEAKRLLQQALTISPQDEIAVSELANIYRVEGSNFDAEILYRQALELSYKDPRPLRNLAEFLKENGAEDEARELFEKADELDAK